MPPGIVVFLMGRQRAGKDTAADYLVHYYGFRRAALAQPVYAIGREVFGMTAKDRGLLIQIGAKMREIDALVFAKALWRSALARAGEPASQQAIPPGTLLVVTDARFPNEWDFFKARGGIAVRIAAAQEVRSLRRGYHAEFEHDATETGLVDAPADAVIVNEGTYGQFYDALDAFATSTLGLVRADGA